MNEQTLQDNWEAIHENYLADAKQSLVEAFLHGYQRLHVNSGFYAPSTYNLQRFVKILNSS